MERSGLYIAWHKRKLFPHFQLSLLAKASSFRTHHAIFCSSVFQHLYWRDITTKDADYSSISPGSLSWARGAKRPGMAQQGCKLILRYCTFQQFLESHRPVTHFSHPCAFHGVLPSPDRHCQGCNSENSQVFPCKELKLWPGLFRSNFWSEVTQCLYNEHRQLTNVNNVCRAHIDWKKNLKNCPKSSKQLS